MTPTTKTSDEGTEGRTGFDLKAVVPAVIGSLTAIGWVTFVGGAILWISFSQASLPAAEATARVPTSVLISSGAEFLVYAVAAALAVGATVALLVFRDEHRRDGAQDELIERRRLERSEAQSRYEQSVKARSRAKEALANSEAARDEADLALRACERSDSPSEAQTHAASRTAREAAEAEAGCRVWADEAGEAELQASETLTAAKRSLKQALSPSAGSDRAAIGVGAVLMVVAIFAVWTVDLGYGTELSLIWIVVGLLVVILGAAGALAYKLTDGRWPAVALVAVLGLPLVMGVASGIRISEAPRVEPVALLTNNGLPLVGFFVAQDASDITIGTFEETVGSSKVPPSMQTIARDSVASILVGPRLPLFANDATATSSKQPRSAREWAGKAAIAMCAKSREFPAAAPAAASAEAGSGSAPDSAASPRCTSGSVKGLRNFVATETEIIDAHHGG